MVFVDGTQRDFLGVSNSLRGLRWVERLDGVTRNTATAIAQTTGIPELVARVIAARGIGQEEAERFLDPKLRDLMPDPSVLTGMEAAAARLAAAVTRRERIAIFGDYDVDGGSSAAMLKRFFAGAGCECEIYIPDRIFEGYGPNVQAMRELADRGNSLIITADCGATSFEALEEAARLGRDVVVLDHHQMGVEMPVAHALVNPNRQDDLSGLGHLCAAGVVFMTLVAVQRELRKKGVAGGVDLMSLLDLVALATVCDVVPLKGLNRAFVVSGLKVMRSQANVGLTALARAARLDGPVQPYHLGFLLGPRINAGGRIGDAALGARLLSTSDEYEANEIAEQLEKLNAERQAVEAVMLEEAFTEADAELAGAQKPAVLITERQGWHPGVVGLLASRMKDRYRLPSIAIAFDGNGKGTGSGRSIAGVDLGKAVRAAVSEGVVEKGGGHPMAAGITVRREKLGDLRAFMEERLRDAVLKANEAQVLKLDGALSARGASLELHGLLEKAGPYGAGHPQPMFALPNHLIVSSSPVGRDHVSATLKGSDGATLRAIGFRIADEALGRALIQGQGRRFHIAGNLDVNVWQGQRRMQLRISDAAPAEA
ncbi:MAG: single-stranded-DNA-specific exonuclease RecJ [Nitratireductor sp.]|nr:single-stranded-DNA-specific exonuclease RecJ [Nitratireductor sp.]